MSFPLAACSTAGAFSLSAIDEVRVGILSLSGQTSNVTLNYLAAVKATVPKATVMFTFDDGFENAWTVAQPTLTSSGFAGTAFLITKPIIGGSGSYLTINQVQSLQNQYGWDIACHTYDHPPNLTTLSPQGVDNEYAMWLQWAAQNGITFVPAVAYPDGVFNDSVQTETRKYFVFARVGGGLSAYGSGKTMTNPDLWEYGLWAEALVPTTSLATAESWVDRAIANKSVLIITFHGLSANPTGNDWSSSDFASLVAYVHDKVAAGSLQVQTFSQLIKQVYPKATW